MSEMRTAFHEELDEVKHAIVKMAGRVTESIHSGTELFLLGDLDGAAVMIEEDEILNSMCINLEEHIYQMIARQGPVAGDLRAITTALWMTGEIERSGDLMVNIVKAGSRIVGAEIDPKVRGLLVEMSEEAARLFRLAIDAYVDNDAGLAAALDDLDDRLDDLNLRTTQAIFEQHEDKSMPLQVAVQLALVCRFYERIGDHGVNIGERVRYMVEGWLPEHATAARTSVVAATADDESPATPGDEQD